MPMTSEALRNGIYMRPLTKKQTVGVMLGTLMEWYHAQGQEEAVIEVANLALAQDPKDVSALLHMGGAYEGMRRREFEAAYAGPADVPLMLRARLSQLDESIQFWRGKAESLGWREPAQNAQ